MTAVLCEPRNVQTLETLISNVALTHVPRGGISLHGESDAYPCDAIRMRRCLSGHRLSKFAISRGAILSRSCGTADPDAVRMPPLHGPMTKQNVGRRISYRCSSSVTTSSRR